MENTCFAKVGTHICASDGFRLNDLWFFGSRACVFSVVFGLASAMDLGSLVLLSLFASMLLNLGLILYLTCCISPRQDDPQVKKATKAYQSDDAESPKKDEIRKRVKRCNEIIVFPAHGKVFHQSNCKHVQKASGTETRTYVACKDCCKNVWMTFCLDTGIPIQWFHLFFTDQSFPTSQIQAKISLPRRDLRKLRFWKVMAAKHVRCRDHLKIALCMISSDITCCRCPRTKRLFTIQINACSGARVLAHCCSLHLAGASPRGGHHGSHRGLGSLLLYIWAECSNVVDVWDHCIGYPHDIGLKLSPHCGRKLCWVCSWWCWPGMRSGQSNPVECWPRQWRGLFGERSALQDV